jgi:hypothetical protein
VSPPTAAEVWREVLDGDIDRAITASLRDEDAVIAPEASEQGRPVALIFEPSLSSSMGHHIGLTRTHRDLLQGLGYRPFVFHSRASSLSGEDAWVPYFVVPHHTMAHRKLEDRQELMRVQRYFAAIFGRLIASYRPAVCVLPTARFTNLAGLAEAMASRGVTLPGKLVAGVMEATDPPDCEDTSVPREAFADAARILGGAGVEHRIITETYPVRDALIASGFSTENLMIHPGLGSARGFRDGPSARTPDRPLRIGFVGDSRPVKSPEVLVDLLLADDRPWEARFVLQLDLGYLERLRGAEAVRKLRDLDSTGAIELHPPGLPEQRFAVLFQSLDVVLLPYTRRYRQIGSGIVVEAIRGGVVPVLPLGSSMDHLYRSVGGRAPTLAEISVGALRRAVDECEASFAELSARAGGIRRDWPSHPWSRESWARELGRWLA